MIEKNIYNDFLGSEDCHQFSFFQKPIQNTKPNRAITPPDIYRYIVGPYAKPQTEMLRSLKDKEEARRYKATHFDTALSLGSSAHGTSLREPFR